MRISEEVLNCVCFVCRRDRRGNYKATGTAFLVSYPAEGWRENYLISARHVIAAARGNDGLVHLRMNTSDGGVSYVAVSADKWWTPEDEAVDVAALPFPYDPGVHAILMHASMFATPAAIATHQIGIGDDVAIIGLFTSFEGQQRNRPIVRTGTIAAMPDEPIVDYDENAEGGKGAPYFAYLIEVRSHGGLSGSPVCVSLGTDRDAEGKRIFNQPSFVLGLVRAHWEGPTRAPYGSFSVDSESGTVNTGIALVTPMDEVAKLLRSEKVARHRAQQELADSLGFGRVALDSASAPGVPGREPERLVVDGTYENAAKKLTRTPRPPGGFPKPGGGRKRKPKG